MNDMIQKIRDLVDAEIGNKPEGELVDWSTEHQNDAINAFSKETGIPLLAWGMNLKGEKIAQALVPMNSGRIVIDVDGEVFYEISKTIRIDLESETERTIVESDQNYALERAFPDEYREMIGLLEKLGMKIKPTVSLSNSEATLIYARNPLESA